MIDSGSQKSYATQQVKDALSLPVIGSQHLSIAAFDSSKGMPKQYDLVRLTVRTKYSGSQELDLFVVPHICDPLTNGTCSRMT